MESSDIEINATSAPNRTSSSFFSCHDQDISSDELTPLRWISPDPQSSLATGIVLLIYTVIGVPMILFIIIVILYKKLYKQPTHIVFLALAFNDLFMCLTYFPFNIISAFAGEFIFGSDDLTRCRVCKIGFIFPLFIHINVFFVALLSLDRFIFIRFPLYYPRLVTVKTTIVAVVVIVIVCIIISVPPLFGFGEIRFTHSISTCSLYLLGLNPISGIPNIHYEIFSIVVCIAGPVVVLLVTNTWLVSIVQKQLSKLYKTNKEDKKSKDPVVVSEYDTAVSAKNKKQWQLVKVFGGILVVNLLTWLPTILNVSVLLALNQNFFSIPHGFFVTLYLLFCSQVFLHPLLKIYLIPDIRQTVSGYTGKKLRRRRATLQLNRSNSVFVSEPKRCCGCFDKISDALSYRNASLSSEATELSQVSSRTRFNS